MRVIRTEEMQRLDVNDVRHELTKVRAEKKRLDAYENDLEIQLGKLMRSETDHKATHTDDLDPGPRDRFLKDTNNMHLTREESAAKAGVI